MPLDLLKRIVQNENPKESTRFVDRVVCLDLFSIRLGAREEAFLAAVPTLSFSFSVAVADSL